MNLPCFGTDSSRSGKPVSVTTNRNHVHHLLWALVIHVNRCGFHIVEFYNKFHPDPNDPEGEHMDLDNQFPDGMFKFEKIMNGGRK